MDFGLEAGLGSPAAAGRATHPPPAQRRTCRLLPAICGLPPAHGRPVVRPHAERKRAGRWAGRDTRGPPGAAATPSTPPRTALPVLDVELTSVCLTTSNGRRHGRGQSKTPVPGERHARQFELQEIGVVGLLQVGQRGSRPNGAATADPATAPGRAATVGRSPCPSGRCRSSCVPSSSAPFLPRPAGMPGEVRTSRVCAVVRSRVGGPVDDAERRDSGMAVGWG
ncbi:hypothetical protein FB475_6394 [Kribbella jejuensis]|uniref:Uncharacterized protein n=1 Tax=Kribbella jejuensis TaxID=236068 RepID=A0A542DUF5_9ACTN|nr:hypothetical protein FB475_6394 [Kribbella jejuensis]